MNKNQSITRPLLYSAKECKELGLPQYKLQNLVKQGLLKRVKSRLDKSFTYYLKEEVNSLLNELYIIEE